MNNNPFSLLKKNFNGGNQTPPINQQQFRQFLPQLNNNMIEQIVAQARQQGISEQDIQNGLNFIFQLR